MIKPCLFALLSFGYLLSASATPPATADVARQVDQSLAAELFDEQTKLASRTDDGTFARRVWLDIVGDIPTPEELTAFVLDPAKDKRTKLVAKLLASPHYGLNWARFLREVILLI
jgi:hypothetical protein